MTAPTVDHPAHYQSTRRHGDPHNLEVIDVIEMYGLGQSFHLGNAAKYLLRAGAKGDVVTDLQKARWYVARHISIEAEEPVPDEAVGDLWPDDVVDAFGLEGDHRRAVRYLLEHAAFEGPDVPSIGAVLGAIDAAIAEAFEVLESAGASAP